MDQKLLASPDEAAEILGVCRAMVFRLIADKTIPSIKVGRLRRIPMAGLRDWVQRQVETQNAVAIQEERCALVTE